MSRLIEKELAVEEEITHFCAEPQAYYAITRSGRLLMIKNTVMLYPEIADEEHYDVFMCMETQEGFFLLRQNIKNKTASPWFLEKQLFPYDPPHFLEQFKNAFENGSAENMPLQRPPARGNHAHA